MNQSPNSLRDVIRLENSDLSEVGIVKVDNHYYITESSMINFMNSYDINSSELFLESLENFNNIDSISILNENIEDENLKFARDMMMLCESINPFEVQSASAGRGLLRMCMTQIADMVSHSDCKESTAVDVDRYIAKCDSALRDIQDERRKIRDKKSTLGGQAKFSGMYLFNITKTLFFSVVLPIAASKGVKTVNWPNAIRKIFVKQEGKAVTGMMTKEIAKGVSKKTIRNAAFMGLDVAVSVPSDIKGLYLSVTDYEKLLDEYEREINRTRGSLIQQKVKLDYKRR